MSSIENQTVLKHQENLVKTFFSITDESIGMKHFRYTNDDYFSADDSIKPMASILFSFSSRFNRDYSLISAAAVMMALPMAILFLLFQRHFIAGLTNGSSKG